MFASMISTKGVELTNYINPDLTWKTVSKGYKRSTRRSRKLNDKSSKFDGDLANREIEDMSEPTVSESEKLGVAVLGQRFGDKIEHVPIKKRRFMVRSLSPPPCLSSPYSEKNQQLMNVPNCTDRKSFPNYITTQQVVAINAKEVKSGYAVDDRVIDGNIPEDFSGIEILAAAACNNSVSDDVENVEDPTLLKESSQEAMDLLQSVISWKAVASLEAFHSSAMYVHEDTKGGFLFQDKAVEKNLKLEDGGTEERHASSQDSRLHWDLNVGMDAWEQQPCDAVVSQTDTVRDILPLEPCGEPNESMERSDIESPLQSIIDNEEHGLEASSVIDRNEDICVPTVKALEESLISADFDAKPCSQSDEVDASLSLSSSQRSKSFMVSGLAEENEKVPHAVVVDVKMTTEDPASAVLPGETTSDEKGPLAFLCAEEGTACEADSTFPNGEEDERSCMESSMLVDVKSPRDIARGPASYEHKPVNKGEEAGVSSSKLNSEGLCSSGTSRGDCPQVSTMNAADHVDHVAMVHTVDSAEVLHSCSENSSPITVEVIGASSHDTCQKHGDSSTSSLGRITTEENYDDSCDLEFSEKNQHIDHVNAVEFEVDYDSQYEDGELRETDVPYWDYACEDEEVECVDYGSDTCENNDVVNVISRGSNSVLEKHPSVETGDGEGKAFESNQLLGGSEIFSNRGVQTIQGCTTGKYAGDCLNGFDDKDSRVRFAGSRAFRMEVTHPEGSLSSHTLPQKDSVYLKRSGNLDSCNQPDQAGSDHSVNKDRGDSQMAGRSPRHISISNPSDSLWDSKHHESAIPHGCFGSGHLREKCVIQSQLYAIHSEAPAGVVRAGNHVDRQAMYSSNGLCRPLFRRPCVKDGTDNMHRVFIPTRGTSPGRRRFRRYPQGVSRGFREEYQRPFPNESEEYFNHVPHRMLRREHNFSPPNRAPAYYRRPYKRSQSRSRSRSPVTWFSQREQNEVLKHRRTSSPDYRFEARMERTRLPFQKHSFEAKYDATLLSQQKRRFSPQFNSRWYGDLNGSGFRGRRLPGRTFQQNQRFESVGSSRRFNSDDYFEPIMRPARFSEMGRGGRVRRYDGSDDERRKSEGRYDINHRVRRYDSDGLVRRFRYDEEGSLLSRSKHNDCDDGGGSGRRPRVAHQEESVMKRKVN